MRTWTALVMLALMGVSSVAFGSGKISLQMDRYFREQATKPSGGLSIYEKLPLGFAYNSWTGAGLRPHLFGDDVTWFASKHDLERWFGQVGVAFGYLAQYNTNEGPVQHSVHAKVTAKLW